MSLFNTKTGVLLTTVLAATYFTLFMLAESQLVIFALVILAGVIGFLSARQGIFRKIEDGFSQHRTLSSWTVLAAILCIAAVFYEDHFTLLMLTTVLIFASACLGLNIQFGYAGLVNFAGAAFFGAGGYTAAVLSTNTGLSHVLILILGGLASMAIGALLILPVLRTKGHYAAVVTIAFSLLFRTLVEVSPVLGGAQGIFVSGFELFGWEFNQNIQLGSLEISFYANYFVTALIIAVLVYVLVQRLEGSWIGLNLDTVRLDETASSCFGLNVSRWKVTAFVIGNFIMGVMGAFYAMMLGFIAPNNFTFGDSLIMVSIILLGGLGSIRGILLATAIVIILPEKLQAIQEYRFLFFAVGVMLVLLFKPNGLLQRGIRNYIPGRSKEVRI